MITDIIYCTSYEEFLAAVRKAEKLGYKWNKKIFINEIGALGLALLVGFYTGVTLTLLKDKAMIYTPYSDQHKPVLWDATDWLKGEE